MRDYRGAFLGLLTITLAATPACLSGSGQRTGTNGASELLIPVGTRDIALGGATVAVSRGIDALFWNPAGSAGVTNDVTVYASHMNYIADIGVDYGAVSALFRDFGVVSLHLRTLSVGDIPVTTAEYPDGTGNTFRPQFFTAGLTYARQLTDRIAVGVTGLVIGERLGEVGATGVGFNAGVTYANVAGVAGFDFGVVVKNIGPQMRFTGPGLSVQATSTDLGRGTMTYAIEAADFELPSSMELGCGYRITPAEQTSLQIALAFENSNFADDAYRVGVEYGFRGLFFLRGGYCDSPSASDERENIFGATFGAGVHADVGTTDVTFDYAYRASKFFGGNHVFSAKIGF